MPSHKRPRKRDIHHRCGKLWSEHKEIRIFGWLWVPVCDDEYEEWLKRGLVS